MLVLTRRLEEGIKIGVDIEIKILEIRKNAVRIGIVAPKDVSVHRSEVYEIIQKENVLASKSDVQNIHHLGSLFKKKGIKAKKD